MDKRVMLLAVGVGSIVGGYVPRLFGASDFSLWGVLTAAIGSIVALLLARRFLDY